MPIEELEAEVRDLRAIVNVLVATAPHEVQRALDRMQKPGSRTATAVAAVDAEVPGDRRAQLREAIK